MGIEKFFNTLKYSYKTKIITKFEPKTIYPSKFLLIDFNSIIHNISQSISTSLSYLYHIILVSNIKPSILKLKQDIIKKHIDNIKTDIILNANINILDESSNPNTTSISDIEINFNELSLDNLNNSFFNLIMFNDNLDKLIIHKVSAYVKSLIVFYPKLEYIYLAIDGVPLFAKMLEQKHRRTIGYIQQCAEKAILNQFKKELDIEPNINNPNDEIYYNQYQFEKTIQKLKFNKNKISPATQFMADLEKYIVNYLNINLPSKIKAELDSYNLMGEGEKKIIYKIHELHNNNKLTNESIVIYSPDADVILLSLIESDKTSIYIMRYDQQQNQLDMIDINNLKNIIINYIKADNKSNQSQHRIICDIVMLFTLLGDDFLPKIDIINTNRHIKFIFDAYLRLQIDNDFIFDDEINWKHLKNFLTNLKSLIGNQQNEFYRRNKDWTLEPDQIINSNSLEYLKHIFNLREMTNQYLPTTNHIKKIYPTHIQKRLVRKYIQGFIWLNKYYLKHNFNYKLFYYKYDIAPTLEQLIDCINDIIANNKILDKILFNLEKTIPTMYFTPYTQLIYISPINITDIIDKKLLNNNLIELINTYDNKYNIELNITSLNNIINIYDFLDCSKAIYLNKCHIKGKKIKISTILQLLTIIKN